MRRRPRVRLKTLLILVAASAALAALASRWARPSPRAPRWDPTGPILSIEPPPSARFADPYDPDRPSPP